MQALPTRIFTEYKSLTDILEIPDSYSCLWCLNGPIGLLLPYDSIVTTMSSMMQLMQLALLL
jgi:hypothetical protein